MSSLMVLATILFLSLASVARAADYRSLETAILAETNRLRANPKAYAKEIRDWRSHLKGKALHFATMRVPTQEGAAPIDETLAKLEATSPLSSLTRVASLDKAARDHASDQAKSGGKGHVGSDGTRPSTRMARYGKVTKTRENISYGPYFAFPNPARALVVQLLVDDGVKDRGHRTTLLMPELTVTGVACDQHPSMTVVCVMTYAAGIK